MKISGGLISVNSKNCQHINAEEEKVYPGDIKLIMFIPMPYSIDFRRHIPCPRKKEELTYAEASGRFSIGIASLLCVGTGSLRPGLTVTQPTAQD